MASPPSHRPRDPSDVDVVVIGAGPAGTAAALAHARRGARVALLEANPAASARLAGEWLHPPAVAALKGLGIDVASDLGGHATGRGFVVLPDDGSAPIALDYDPRGGAGFSVEHHTLVERLRAEAADHALVTYHPGVRARTVAPGHVVTSDRRGRERAFTAARIIGADGRASVVRRALGLGVDHTLSSRMAGLVLRGARLPHEGYGHLVIGPVGPILAYRVGPDAVRVCLDVPASARRPRDTTAFLWDAFAPHLPETLRDAFAAELRRGAVRWAACHVRPRVDFGRDGLVLIGDACGHYHPLTALGMTLGFGDAIALAEADDVDAYRRRRARETLLPEMLAVGLYEVFADTSDEAVAIRRAVYDLWRTNPAERRRTMRYLAIQERRTRAFAASFTRAVARGARQIAADALTSGRPDHALEVGRALGDRLRWLVAGVTRIAPPTGRAQREALETSAPRGELLTLAPHDADAPSPERALRRGVARLTALQQADGRWEAEVRWNEMLAAQWILAHHVMGRPLAPERRERALRAFALGQRPDGLWGLSDHGGAYLFTTTLVYVAARLLGVAATDPLLTRAGAFIREQSGGEGGAAAIPTWGKLWLALAGLYDWRGVPALLPELWHLPEALPLHPSRWYSHTRLIYQAMAALAAAPPNPPENATLTALRDELFPEGWRRVDWGQARRTVRPGDMHVPRSPLLEAAYAGAGVAARLLPRALRRYSLRAARGRIRSELRATDHTSISPVSGLLNALALWVADPRDPDVERALTRMEAWVWEDDADGFRVAGARSASWDTAFALQALHEARALCPAPEAERRGAAFLKTQQIPAAPSALTPDRLDPTGGYCFGEAWHGWPVSDCTAEALVALHHADALAPPSARAAARFVLSCQNADGGFGSYEAQRTRLPLDRLNPSEMFGACMTERSYTECTASSVEALAVFAARAPGDPLAGPALAAVDRGVARLLALQEPDGPWHGAWGIHFTYGTCFAVRGLLAAGLPGTHPAIKRACAWLRTHQRPDGAWGEDARSAVEGRYVAHAEGQVHQTAWALMTLVAAGDPDLDAIDRAAAWLAATQRADGSWPAQDMTGVFFETAPLDYPLYRQTFPVQALARYLARVAARPATTARAAAKAR